MMPQPAGAFQWVQAAAGPALRCRPLERVAPHLFTTRAWRLGSTASAADDAAWDEVARAMDVDRAQLARVHQVHGAAVAIHRAGSTRPAAPPADDRDIIVSDDPDLALAIQTADCVPLLVADTRTRAVAAAHAGWRGLADRVPRVAVEALARAFGSRPSDLVVAAGPSIGVCCYEVGEDVRARFAAAGFSASEIARWFSSDPRPSLGNPSMAGLPCAPRAGHWFFDGWTAARDQLEGAGVPADAIHLAALCTASHAGALCSYRRDGAPAGRMAAAIRCAPRRPSPRSPADPRAR